MPDRLSTMKQPATRIEREIDGCIAKKFSNRVRARTDIRRVQREAS